MHKTQSPSTSKKKKKKKNERRRRRRRKEMKVLKKKIKNYVLQHSIILLNIVDRCS